MSTLKKLLPVGVNAQRSNHHTSPVGTVLDSVAAHERADHFCTPDTDTAEPVTGSVRANVTPVASAVGSPDVAVSDVPVGTPTCVPSVYAASGAVGDGAVAARTNRGRTGLVIREPLG